MGVGAARLPKQAGDKIASRLSKNNTASPRVGPSGAAGSIPVLAAM